MFRLWGKVYKNHKTIQDMVYENSDLTIPTEEKVKLGLYEICMAFDLQHPIWLKGNHKDMEQFKRTAFRKDHFIEQIEFDHLEIEIIEEDKKEI